MADNSTTEIEMDTKKMDEKAKHDMKLKDNRASTKNLSGAAGSTEAAKRGGEHSHKDG
jgi:hypothetical protein